MSPNDQSLDQSIDQQEQQKADTPSVKPPSTELYLACLFARLACSRAWAWESLVAAFFLLCGLVWFGWLIGWLERHTYSSLCDLILISIYGEAIYSAHPVEASKGGSQGLFSVGKKVSN